MMERIAFVDFLGNTIFVSAKRVDEYKARGYVLLADLLKDEPKAEPKAEPKVEKPKKPTQKKKATNSKKRG